MIIKNNKIHVCELGVLINLFNINAKNIFKNVSFSFFLIVLLHLQNNFMAM